MIVLFEYHSKLKVVDSYIKFTVLALVTLLIGVPLWTLLLAPDEFSLSMITDPRILFWIGLGMVFLLYGFSKGQQTKIEE